MSDPSVDFMKEMRMLLLNWKAAMEAAINPSVKCNDADWKKIEGAALTDIGFVVANLRDRLSDRRDDGSGYSNTDEAYEAGRDMGWEEGYAEGDNDGRAIATGNTTAELQPIIDDLRMQLDIVNGEMASKIEDLEAAQNCLKELEEQLNERSNAL